MKLVKMSLAAAVLLGASAFGIDNVKVSGDAKLFYLTDDRGADIDLFDKDSAAADAALRVSVTGDLLKNVSFGVTGNAISTLGLENNLVSHVWEGNGQDQSVMSELWLATTMGKTTAKVGRMELDTPLAFSEKWSILTNTFDAAVLINQDLPNTTLVGAWVGKGNGSVQTGEEAVVMTPDLAFSSFYQGAYAVAAINNSFKPLTVQAWYYDVQHTADAFWLQADWDCQLVKNVKIGAQYADISTKGATAGLNDSSAYAFKVAYSGVENLTLSAAYSDTKEDGALKVANIATTNTTSQSKLYTEAWWNYGYVGAEGAESINLSAEYVASFAKLGAYYTTVSTNNANEAGELDEITLTATKSYGPLDVTLAYVNYTPDALKSSNNVQAYLTLNF